MVERIREILDAKQLSPTQFADAIAVARPIVSHILSGRNKPSLEVVQKIIAAFPDIALPWLLSGTGAMRAVVSNAELPLTSTDAGHTVKRSASKAPKQALQAPRDLFQGSTAEGSLRAAEAPFNAPSAFAGPTAAKAAELLEPVAAPLAPVALPQLSVGTGQQVGYERTAPAPVYASGAPAAQPGFVVDPLTQPETMKRSSAKAIRRIVIFYQDGTFTDYQPE